MIAMPYDDLVCGDTDNHDLLLHSRSLAAVMVVPSGLDACYTAQKVRLRCCLSLAVLRDA